MAVYSVDSLGLMYIVNHLLRSFFATLTPFNFIEPPGAHARLLTRRLWDHEPAAESM
jgi:hypothetical protein